MNHFGISRHRARQKLDRIVPMVEALERRRLCSVATNLPADAAGETYSAALDVDVVAKKRHWTGSIGNRDRADIYKVVLTEDRHFLANLSGLSGNLNLEIDRDANGNGQYDAGDLVARSTRHGTRDETLSIDLDAGTYFVRVYNPVATASSSYDLSLQATPTSAQAMQTFADLAARAMALASSGNFDLFVNVTGAPGESVDPKHTNWIDASSYSFSVASNSSFATVAPKSTFGDLQIIKLLDKASPRLFLDAAQISRITSVVVDLVTTDKRLSFFKIALTNARVSGISQTGSVGGQASESVSFNFEKIKLVYTPFNDDGDSLPAVQVTWDLKANRAA